MKSNENKKQNGLALKVLLLTGVFAVTATVMAAGIYKQSQQQIDRGQQDEAALNRVLEARVLNMVIQQLNSGHETEARACLNKFMQGDLQQAELLAKSAGPGASAEVKVALKEFAKDEKAHPEYYAMAQKTKSPTSIQLARQAPSQQ